MIYKLGTTLPHILSHNLTPHHPRAFEDIAAYLSKCRSPHSVVVTLFWIGNYLEEHSCWWISNMYNFLNDQDIYTTHVSCLKWKVDKQLSLSIELLSGYFNSTLNPVIYVMTNRLFTYIFSFYPLMKRFSFVVLFLSCLCLFACQL